MKETILIASASLDEHTYGPVKAKLESRDYDVLTYLTDEVLYDRQPLLLDITPDGGFNATYGGRSMHPNDIGACWYRKLSNYEQKYNKEELARQLYVNAEIGHVHESLWGVYPDEMWLNSPRNIKNADRKFGQLLLAQELGFAIPRTVLTNEWTEIQERLLAHEADEAIVKAIRGVISKGNVPQAMYTTPINAQTIERLKAATTPFPGIYQPFLHKKQEWRVTVVGERVFAASIETTDKAKDDWRKHQLTDAVSFKREKFPDTLSQMCVQYLGRMGLKYGAFDFIETKDNEVVFLECNPNGQYMWLEKDLGLPISDAIADELIRIASARR